MSAGRLTASDRFLAVVYEYRYLALAGRAWNDLGPSGSEQTQRAANKLLPGIGVLVQDSLLLHARQLIDFYTTSAGRKDDVVLADGNLVRSPEVENLTGECRRQGTVTPVRAPRGPDESFGRSRCRELSVATRGASGAWVDSTGGRSAPDHPPPTPRRSTSKSAISSIV